MNTKLISISDVHLNYDFSILLQKLQTVENFEDIIMNALKRVVDTANCQTAHCGRCEQHFIVGTFTSPTVRFGR